MYEKNDLITLKREALVANDVQTLRAMREYERDLRVFYKRRGEDAIRDSDGQAVEPEESSIFEIIEALQGPIEDLPPGELIKRIREGKTGMLIIELLPGAEFPVAANALRPKHSGELDRIAGVGFRRACPGLYFVRVEDLTTDQEAEFLEMQNRVFNF